MLPAIRLPVFSISMDFAQKSILLSVNTKAPPAMMFTLPY